MFVIVALGLRIQNIAFFFSFFSLGDFIHTKCSYLGLLCWSGNDGVHASSATLLFFFFPITWNSQVIREQRRKSQFLYPAYDPGRGARSLIGAEYSRRIFFFGFPAEFSSDVPDPEYSET